MENPRRRRRWTRRGRRAARSPRRRRGPRRSLGRAARRGAAGSAVEGGQRRDGRCGQEDGAGLGVPAGPDGIALEGGAAPVEDDLGPRSDRAARRPGAARGADRRSLPRPRRRRTPSQALGPAGSSRTAERIGAPSATCRHTIAASRSMCAEESTFDPSIVPGEPYGVLGCDREWGPCRMEVHRRVRRTRRSQPLRKRGLPGWRDA